MSQVVFQLKPSQPKEFGYFAINVSGRIEGSAVPVNSSVGLTGISGGGKTAVEGKISTEVSENWKVSLKSKVDQKKLDEIVAVFKDGGGGNPVKRLAAAFGSTLGAEVSHKNQIGPADIDVGGGVELSQTPFYFYSKWSGSNTTFVLGMPLKYKVTIDGRVYVGLSKLGWTEVARRVGPNVIRQVLTQAGTSIARLLTFVASSGVLTAAVAIVGGIAGTFGLIVLGAAVTGHARKEGAARGIEAWYVSAYSAKVFYEPRPSGYIWTGEISNADQLVKLMIESGEKDAINDARQTARRLGDRDADSISDELILRRHRARLESLYGGKTSTTKFYLQQELKEHAKEKLGLR